jgi:hypothetical protein
MPYYPSIYHMHDSFGLHHTLYILYACACTEMACALTCTITRHAFQMYDNAQGAATLLIFMKVLLLYLRDCYISPTVFYQFSNVNLVVVVLEEGGGVYFKFNFKCHAVFGDI